LVVVVVAVGIAVFALQGAKAGANSSGYAPHNTTPMASNGTQNTSGSAVLFDNTMYAGAAYMIFPNRSTSPQATVASSDYVMSVSQNGNGTSTLSLNFTDSGVVYNVTVKNDQKVYFIDANLGDDNIGGDHYYTGDDGYAVVDSNGYIVSVDYPLPKS
jgi:hypothetical protein